ncbi:TPA: hypothetical protein LS257_001826 [Serratia liquefaciens]|uniref:hypothetical protein n=1 Tax=Serratia liquefaciens TaxID=614 RepID=UPI001F2A3A16|nr:hypothetical protein [Serratia liquefaciens]MCE9941628.1 hypothetical protein [Serratia liquefaciens]HBL7239204.1 hypothetical protein [Serratia liquefaciens]
MVTRRALLGGAIPVAVASGMAYSAPSGSVGGSIRVIGSVDDLKSSSGLDGEVAMLQSYHQGMSTGGGAVYFNPSSDSPPNMVTSYPGLGGVWHRIIESPGVISCSFGGMLAKSGFDNASYHNNLINFADSAGVDIAYGSGEYLHFGNVEKRQSFSCPNLIGCGGRGKGKGTILKFSDNFHMKIKGGSGILSASVISGITFSGGSENNGVLIVADQCGLSLDRCIFDSCKSGIRMINESPGGFSEFNVLDKCVFTSTCETGMTYERRMGNESFHGTGLRECIFQQQKKNPDSPHVYIGEKCMVYNAPMTIHVFRDYTESPIIKHDGYERSNVYGVITVEKKPKNTVNLVLGKNLYIVGSVICLSENLSTNKAVFCSRFQANSDGSVNYIRNSTSLSGTMSGKNPVDVIKFNPGESAFIDMSIVSAQGIIRSMIFVAVDSDGVGRITDTDLSPIRSKTKYSDIVSFDKSMLKVSGVEGGRWIADVSFVASRFQFSMR